MIDDTVPVPVPGRWVEKQGSAAQREKMPSKVWVGGWSVRRCVQSAAATSQTMLYSIVEKRGCSAGGSDIVETCTGTHDGRSLQ
jgi:hypothetical protein